MLIIRMLEDCKFVRSEGRGKDHNSILSNLKNDIPKSLSIIHCQLYIKKSCTFAASFLNV